MTRIRPIEPPDLRRWVELRCALWPDEAADWLAADAAGFFAGTDTLLEAVPVADDATLGVVGFAELSRRAYAEGCATSPVGYVEGWYVVPARRGQGVGRALIRAAEEWASAHGCREFASDALVENTVSAAAHRALGFEEVVAIPCFRNALQPGAVRRFRHAERAA